MKRLLVVALTSACASEGPGNTVADARPAADARVAGTDGSVADAAPEDGGVLADAASMDASAPDAALPDATLGDAGQTPEGPCDGPGGFCWLNPPGFGATLAGVSGTQESDVWAVGPGGVIFHRGSTGWSQVASPTFFDLRDVSARGTSDVWAVGAAGTVIRYDGATWHSVSGATDDDLQGVHARAIDDVWVVGKKHVYHFDGTTLAPVTLPWAYDPEATEVVSLGPRDVFVGTRFGTMLHFDGTTWSYSESFYHNQAVTDLWASSPADVWAVSNYGTDISRFDGTSWHRIPYVAGQTPETIQGVHGSGPNDVWLAGELGLWHFDGLMYTKYAPPVETYASTYPMGVWAGTNRAIIVGAAGQVFEYSGGQFTLASGSPRGVYERWFDILSLEASNVWFFGLGVAMHYDGTSLQRVETAPTNYRQDFTGSWAAGPNDIWATAIGEWGSNLQHWDGTRFSVVDTGSFFGPDWLLGVWGSAANDLYFAGGPDSFHFDGTTWARLGVGGDIQDIHGTSRSDVWAVSGTGGGGSVPPHPTNGIWHFDGRSWSQSHHDGTWWTSVFALSPSDVWAGGGGGTLKHWDGQTWTQVSIPGVTTADPQNAPFIGGFSGRQSNDVWASIGSNVLHWDGRVWTVLPSLGASINDTAVASDGTVYLTGSSDAVLRR